MAQPDPPPVVPGERDADLRVDAVRSLGQLHLPVDTPAAMKAESVGHPVEPADVR